MVSFHVLVHVLVLIRNSFRFEAGGAPAKKTTDGRHAPKSVSFPPRHSRRARACRDTLAAHGVRVRSTFHVAKGMRAWPSSHARTLHHSVVFGLAHCTTLVPKMFVATIVGDCGVHLHASTRLMALVCRMALVNAGRRCLVLVLDAARARHSPLPTTRA